MNPSEPPHEWKSILADATPAGRLSEKRERILRDIETRIRRGELKGRLPSTRILAEAYGVDFRTVNSAMKLLAEKNVIIRKERSGSFVHPGIDRPQHALGMILGGSEGPLHVRLLGTIQRQAALHGQKLLLDANLQYSRDPLSAGKAAKLALSLGDVDGVILWPHMPDASDAAIQLLSQRKVPFVAVLQVDPSRPFPHHYVISDDRAGMRDAVEHLIKHGHREIAAIGTPHVNLSDLSYEHQRTAGYIEAMQSAGLDQHLYTPMNSHQSAAGVRKLKAFLKNKTAAVFMFTDTLLSWRKAFEKTGIKIPEDLSVIGFGENETAAALGISTVSVPMEQIATQSVDLVLDQIEGRCHQPRHIQLSPELIIRDSCADISSKTS